MFHPRILSQYNYRVIDCNSYVVDAVADVAQYWGVNVYALSDFLRLIGAVGSHRLF